MVTQTVATKTARQQTDEWTAFLFDQNLPELSVKNFFWLPTRSPHHQSPFGRNKRPVMEAFICVASVFGIVAIVVFLGVHSD